MSFFSDQEPNCVREAVVSYPQLEQTIERHQIVIQNLEQQLIHLKGRGYAKERKGIQLEVSKNKQNLSEAKSRKEVFDLAWVHLSDDEQSLLDTWYWQGKTATEAAELLSEQLSCSVSTVRRRRQEALKKLQGLLGLEKRGGKIKRTASAIRRRP